MLPAHIGGIVQHKSTNRVKEELAEKSDREREHPKGEM
jgi:hypothetical protein